MIKDSETQWTPWFLPMFVVANIVVFIVVMYLNNCPDQNNNNQTRLMGKCVMRFLGRFSFEPLRENPLFGPSSSTLKNLGALDLTKVVVNHQRWRLITCIWLHACIAGVIHLLVNTLSLIFIGIRLEQQFGFVRIGIIYLLSGFGGSVMSSLFIRNNVSGGASGALLGLLGSMLSKHITNKVMALLTLLIIIAINLAIGIFPHVDNFAHTGGFLTGFLLGFVLLPRPQLEWWSERRNILYGYRLKPKYKPYQYVLWLVSVVLLDLGFVVALVMLSRRENGNDHCHCPLVSLLTLCSNL